MHPILFAKHGPLLYLGLWTLAGLLLAVAYATAGPASGMEAVLVVLPMLMLYALVCLSTWYICRATPLTVASISRILITQLLASAVTVILWMLAWEGWTLSIDGFYPEAVENYREQMPLIAASGVLLFWSAAMLHYLLIAFENSRAAVTHGMGLEILAREAELKALRAQIDPHFLFNSLNSISALTSTNPRGARDMCILLAAFFRDCVRLGKEESVPLKEELEMVQNYLDIEKIRCGSRLTTRIEVDPECHSCRVPPLILQPLVENAVRHGVYASTAAGSIALTASRKSDRLVLSIENNFEADSQPTSGTGVGLANVRRRIRAMFDRAAELNISRNDGVFRVELLLPCDAASTGAGT